MVLQHQWKYGEDWVKKLRDFDLLTHYGKRKLCESALHSLGYDPKYIPCMTDPDYGHVQLDTSGEAGAEDYDAQISALMEGRTPPSRGLSSLGGTSSGLSGGFASSSTAASNRKGTAKVFDFYDPSMPDFRWRAGKQDLEDSGCHEEHGSVDSYTFK